MATDARRRAALAARIRLLRVSRDALHAQVRSRDATIVGLQTAYDDLRASSDAILGSVRTRLAYTNALELRAETAMQIIENINAFTSSYLARASSGVRRRETQNV